MKRKTIERLLLKYNFQWELTRDARGDDVVRAWPFIPDYEKTRHGLTPSKPYETARFKVQFVYFQNSEYVSNFKVNNRFLSISITKALTDIARITMESEDN